MKNTTDHNEIKKWAEKVNGKPQKIEDSQAADKAGLRIDFKGGEDEIYLSEGKKGRDIAWEEFFRIFEEQKLAFLFEEDPKAEIPTDAYRFIKRNGE